MTHPIDVKALKELLEKVGVLGELKATRSCLGCIPQYEISASKSLFWSDVGAPSESPEIARAIAELIAAAVNVLPALLADLEQRDANDKLVREAIEALKLLVHFIDTHGNCCFCDQWKDPEGLQHSGACLIAQHVMKKIILLENES